MMKKHGMTLTLLAAAFLTGMVIGYVGMTRQVLEDHSPWSWLVEPGVLMSLPIYALAGGVHGGHVQLWQRTIAPCNGLAYAGIIAIVLRTRRYLQSKKN